MIGTDTISRVIGQDVYDESGDKIGSAAEVYLDDETGEPEWVTVRTGLFGTKESFVPIRNADLTNDGVRVPVSKTQVKDAPKIDTDGHLSPQEEQELYRYYGMGTGTAGTETAGFETTGMTETQGTVGHDTSGPTTDDAMTRSEERINVGTRSEEVGRARLRKYVVTENVTETAPVPGCARTSPQKPPRSPPRPPGGGPARRGSRSPTPTSAALSTAPPSPRK